MIHITNKLSRYVRSNQINKIIFKNITNSKISTQNIKINNDQSSNKLENNLFATKQSQSSSNSQYSFHDKIQISIAQNSSLIHMIKKRKTGKQKILESQYLYQWVICWFLSVCFTYAGHMYFPQSYLSKNYLKKGQFQISRNAQQQVLSGKHGTPIISKKK